MLGLLAVAAFASTADAAGLAVDQLVTVNQGTAARTIVSPAFSTTASNELLLAFVSSDGPTASGAQTFATVTGGGVTWQLRRRANAQYGTSEIWQAVAASPLTAAKVTATRLTGSYQGAMTIVSFIGADTTSAGATAGASAATGATSVSLATTRPGAWVWGAGNDWDKAVARTVGPNQTKVSEYLAPAGDTFWVQRQTAPTPTAGTSVALSDTAPTADRWNFAAAEVLPAGTDTKPPSVPTGLKADTVTATSAALSWTASTDDFGVAGYRIFRDGTQVGQVSTTAFTDTGLTSGTSYSYTVKAYDAAGNVSDASDPKVVSTPAPDGTAPTVSLSAPAAGPPSPGPSASKPTRATTSASRRSSSCSTATRWAPPTRARPSARRGTRPRPRTARTLSRREPATPPATRRPRPTSPSASTTAAPIPRRWGSGAPCCRSRRSRSTPR